ncbi:hypothetical protein [Loktanella sp. S4079]|uniref:hypothetical protein n=1 Tax=Loktanella sp. S4079 TaxID=579483 RepID=UPI000AE28D55|nr:hypothetical protein [Loktanella sp. S4079]
MKQSFAFIMMAGLAAACSPTPPTPEEAAQRCEKRAQAAQAPTGGVTVGMNSETGMSTGIEIGLSADFLRGRDPFEVYESCVIDLTGEPPIRPARLRSL